MSKNVIWFNKLGMNDVNQVGGKNASLGELIQHLSSANVKVPNGFATTAQAYRDFLKDNQLNQQIAALLEPLDSEDVHALAQTGQAIRHAILAAPFSEAFIADVTHAYQDLQNQGSGNVAVRSSATAEDLPDASFAGQQETILNVNGIEQVLACIKLVYASLYNDRAISYRVHQNFRHDEVAISAGIQLMVRSDQAASGVMFTVDTESGFEDVIFITSAYGLGETVVQGTVNPDEFYVYKPALRQQRSAILRRNLGQKAIKMIYTDKHQHSGATLDHNSTVQTVAVLPEQQRQFSLTDAEIEQLAQYAVNIEQHYQRPMDIEWAKDGISGELFILQARPETVTSRQGKQTIERYRLLQHNQPVLAQGRSIGQKISSGRVKILNSIRDMDQLKPGDVLVTDMTDPDWEPIMKKAAAIVTNRGGRTCHAAIIARELGIPAVVGCGDVTARLTENMPVTVSCAEGETGFIYQGELNIDKQTIELDNMPTIPTKLMLNVGNPDRAFAFSRLPHNGVGLARLEFIISQMVGIHPNALLHFETLAPELKTSIAEKISAYASPTEYYIERIKEGVSTIAAAFYPEPVIVRLSDFKSNEYANLLGGDIYEPHEENPMLGYRGAGRYVTEAFKACFELECKAIKRARETMGLTNIQVMIPFVRTVEQARQVIELLSEFGLKRGEQDLKIIMMCELPSNALLAEQFLQYFDGFSIGSNDLTQLTLGLDRDSGLVAHIFDERDDAVKALLKLAIDACNKLNKYIGICGQGPSDHPELAQWLVQQGIGSMSLNPDSVLDTWMQLAKLT
ncbi:MAG: phosphoenolpyruvate synthase [Gammaproteobacteria bacterium]